MKRILTYIALCLCVVIIALIATFQYSRSWEHAFFIAPLFRIETNEPVVALTFDDGPSDTNTPALLDILSKYNVKATFFMLGQKIEKYPKVAEAVYEQGHLIGNHSYSHPRLIFKSPRLIREQIEKTDELIKSIGQEEVHFFRPPNTSKYIVLPLILKSLGKQLVTGTYDPPSEYSSPYEAEKVAKEVIGNSKPGSIIYLHDGKSTSQEQFVRSVELIIIGLRNKGYEFVRIDYEQY